MTIIARNRPALLQALHSRGFFLVVDLPVGTRFERRRGMHLVRMP